ncbi:MAG TPA: PaaI family thioesterase [Candidatus Dormibacteraeota bacterium]|jgi:uncharacterized protein (TIGR00369 family)|nr:PaaI family thioesterase [Candidatus Dormibacteraeota bacterium]
MALAESMVWGGDPQVPDRARELVVRWEDPRATAGRGRELAGIDFLCAVMRGEVPPPPMAELMGMSLVLVERGRAVFTAMPGEQHYNPIGMVHGGLAATLLDSAMGCAVQSTLGAGTGFTTLELKVNYVGTVTTATGLLLAEGHVVHRGGRTATAEGRVTAAADGRLLAHASTTCLVLRHDREEGPERPAA